MSFTWRRSPATEEEEEARAARVRPSHLGGGVTLSGSGTFFHLFSKGLCSRIEQTMGQFFEIPGRVRSRRKHNPKRSLGLVASLGLPQSSLRVYCEKLEPVSLIQRYLLHRKFVFNEFGLVLKLTPSSISSYIDTSNLSKERYNQMGKGLTSERANYVADVA